MVVLKGLIHILATAFPSQLTGRVRALLRDQASGGFGRYKGGIEVC